jgi:hypothetical protein
MSDDIEDLGPLFNAVDRQSTTWAKLKKHIEARIESLRVKNDGDLDPFKTARLRGEIAAFKNLLTLAQPAPVDVADDAAE